MKIIIIFFIKIYILFIPFFLYAKEYNIILILSDDQSWAGLSVKMDPNNELSKSLYDETPNLEKLAQDLLTHMLHLQFVLPVELVFKQVNHLRD